MLPKKPPPGLPKGLLGLPFISANMLHIKVFPEFVFKGFRSKEHVVKASKHRAALLLYTYGIYVVGFYAVTAYFSRRDLVWPRACYITQPILRLFCHICICYA